MKKIKTEHCFYLLLMLSAMGAMLWGGCGVKAPPVAPEQPPMPTITDLTAVYSSGRVLLSWHHPGGESPAMGYRVLKSKRSMLKPECPECPMIFERVGTEKLMNTLRARRHTIKFEAAAQAGYLYHFKVVPFESSGAQGLDSNLVEIEVK